MRRAITFCLWSFLTAAGADGQLLLLELSYSNPGARSMGFGGAFVALADDATAAFANPAGLVQLIDPEVSIEGRSWRYSTPYVAGGRATGEPSGRGLDVVAGVREATSSADLAGLSFLSYVHPKGDWSFAAYRHQLANFELAAEVQGLFSDPPGRGGREPVAGVVRDQDARGSLDLEVVSHGFSVAYRWTEAFSVGLGVAHFDVSLTGGSDEFISDDDSPESYFAPNSFLPGRLHQQTTLTVDEDDWGFNLGFLWSLTEGWRLGGFYRQGAEVDGVVEVRSGPVNPFGPRGVVETPVALPDVYGLGVAFRSAGGRLTLAFEWDLVEYSTLVERLDPRLFDPGPTDDAALDPGGVVDDASELHLGGEYVFPRSAPAVALRAGLWHDPDHRIRNTSELAFTRALDPPGEDELHWTLGVGLAFERLQVDVGVDLSEQRDTGSVSMIYSF